MIRLLVCDDSCAARAALRTMLHDQGEIAVVGEAADGEQAVTLAAELAPDVVLMDVAMPILDGVRATSRIRRLLPATRIVAFAGSSERDVVEAMLEAGADAYCVKGAPLWELERAIAGAGDPLLRLAHALTRSASGGIGVLVARELHELTGGAIAAVYLTTETGLSLAGSAGPVAPEDLAAVPEAAVRAYQECAPVPADAGTLSEFVCSGIECGDAFALPLVSDGLPLGAVLVAMPATLPFLIDVELVATVADLAAAAVASERLLLHSRTEARRDGLTGLLNRRAFDERLEDLVAGERPFEIALLDLDDFKRTNGELGHQAGDAVLRAFARVAQRTLRADEDVYRFGGDEFALLIEGENAMSHVVERLLEAARLHRRPRPLPTVSAGVAVSPADGRSKARLLARADDALYAAKRGGKNRVVTPPATGARPRDGGEGTRVLVVDDDAGLRTLLRTTLEAIELSVDEAESAAEARASLGARLPDLVVLDIGLPDTDGLSFCRELKGDPRTAGIPVVILTPHRPIASSTPSATSPGSAMKRETRRCVERREHRYTAGAWSIFSFTKSMIRVLPALMVAQGMSAIEVSFFFDPNFDAEIQPIFSRNTRDDKEERWDRASVHEFQGTYGEYLLNKVSKAPGFWIGNVIVMAGVPPIMQAMLDEVAPKLKTGARMLSVTVRADAKEGDIGTQLGEVAKVHPGTSIGSYPFFDEARGPNTNIVVRARDPATLAAAKAAVEAMLVRVKATL